MANISTLYEYIMIMDSILKSLECVVAIKCVLVAANTCPSLRGFLRNGFCVPSPSVDCLRGEGWRDNG